MKEIMTSLLDIIGSIGVTIFKAFVITKLWVWFMVSIFALPILNMWQVFGILTLLVVLRVKYDKREYDLKKKKGDKSIEVIVDEILVHMIMYAMGLLIGYLISLAL